MSAVAKAPTPSMRKLARIEAMVQALAEDYARVIHGHRGEVVWQEEDGWLRIVGTSPEAGGKA